MRAVFGSIRFQSTPFLRRWVFACGACLWGAAAAGAAAPATYPLYELRNGETMREWLICGPFPNPLAEGVVEYWHDETTLGYGLDYLAPVGSEAGVVPSPGATVPLEGGDPRAWTVHRSAREHVALDTLLSPSSGMLAYASCTIVCEEDTQRLFGLGSNDGVIVWLNGREVWRYQGPRTVKKDDEYLRLDLVKGENRLLLKIVNGGGRWGFMMRPVTDEQARDYLFEDIEEELRFDFHAEGDHIAGRLGAAETLGVLEGLPSCRVELLTPAGEVLRSWPMVLGKQYTYPRELFPEDDYLLRAFVPSLKGDPIVARGYMATYDPIARTRAALAEPYPAVPASPAGEVYGRLLQHFRWLDQVKRLYNDPYTYRRLGEGIERVHAECARLATSATPYDGLFPRPRTIGFTKEEACTLDATWGLRILDGVWPDEFEQELAALWEQRLGAAPNAQAQHWVETVLLADASSFPIEFDSADAFRVVVKPGGIVIESHSLAGLAYGLDTFRQLLQQSEKLPAATLEDAPAFPRRGVFQPIGELDSELRARLDRLARLRYNLLIAPSGDYTNLDDPAACARLRAAITYCRARHLEPVGYLPTFDGGSVTLEKNPDLIEGVFRERVPFVVDAQGQVKPETPRILDMDHARPTVYDEAAAPLERGRDYDLVSKAPPVFQFKGRMQPGAPVFISYDEVDPEAFLFSATCPSAPERLPYIEEKIAAIFERLDLRSIHIGQDEAGYLNRDSRCLARNLSNHALMADQFTQVHAAVRRHAPEATIYIWGDLFNPWQNGELIGAPWAARDIPKDIVVIDWWYLATRFSDLDHVDRSFAYYDELGFKTMGAPWDDPLNLLQLTAQGARYPKRYLGLVHTNWTGYDGLVELTAQASWEGKTILGTPRL